MAQIEAHTTKDEIKFIDGILSGVNNPSNQNYTKHDKVSAVKGYLSGCGKRTDWGPIDKSVVIDYAQKQLMKLKLK